jgi:hypothetical protein
MARESRTINAMNIYQLLSELQAARTRISTAIDALNQINGSAPAKRLGRPPASTSPLLVAKKRTMSKAARAKIAAAQRARWAKQKRAGK